MRLVVRVEELGRRKLFRVRVKVVDDYLWSLD